MSTYAVPAAVERYTLVILHVNTSVGGLQARIKTRFFFIPVEHIDKQTKTHQMVGYFTALNHRTCVCLNISVLSTYAHMSNESM